MTKSLLLALAVAFTLTACDKKADTPPPAAAGTTPSTTPGTLNSPAPASPATTGGTTTAPR